MIEQNACKYRVKTMAREISHICWQNLAEVSRDPAHFRQNLPAACEIPLSFVFLGLEELCLVLTRSEFPSVLFRDGDLITKRSKSSCRQELFSLTKSKLEGHLLSCWGTS